MPQGELNFGELLTRVAEEAPLVDEQETVYIFVKDGDLPVYYKVAGVGLSIGHGPDGKRAALVINAGEVSSVG